MAGAGGFGDVLKAATEIKTAQLKARPGRQEWERSPDWFKYTGYPDKQTAALRLEPCAERMQTAQQLKQHGNEMYELEPQGALEVYTKAISLFVWFDRGKDRASEDVPLVNGVAQLPTEEERAQADQLVSTCFTNAASCLIRMQKWEDALYACNKALDHDPYSVKALYRRASALHGLGTSTGLEAAVRDMQQALKLEPGNSAVRSALSKLQAELLEQNKRDRKTFGNMFSRGELYSEEDLKAAGVQAAGGPRPGGGRQQRQQRRRADAARDDGDGDEDGDMEEEEDEELDEFGRRQGRGDVSPEELAAAMRSMQRNLHRARTRREHQAALRQQGVVGMAGAGGVNARSSWLPQLPWWAWALILLHLLYRVFKIWTTAPPHRQPPASAGPDDAFSPGGNMFSSGNDEL